MPAHVRQRRGVPRDERAMAIGLPPVEPHRAVMWELAEEVGGGGPLQATAYLESRMW